jgi:mannose-6-phosphate isomerase-like protein (cupin superfamily)
MNRSKMNFNPANLKEKFGLFDEYWTPKIVGELNEQYVKLAKLKGEFIWHSHENEDELFYIIKGKLTLKFREDKEMTLNEGEMYIVPAGVEHFPLAKEECWVMLIEPKSTEHTGSTQAAGTVAIKDQEWI